MVKVSEYRSGMRRLALMKTAALTHDEFKEIMRLSGAKREVVDPEYSAYRRRILRGKILAPLLGSIYGGVVGGVSTQEPIGAVLGAGAGGLTGFGLAALIDKLNSAASRERLKAIKEKREPAFWSF